MRLFFDNCTSPVLASTLHGFVQHRGHQAFHIKDLPCGRSAPDVEWISFLFASGHDWIVITGDLRISRNKAEREIYRRAGLKGIALAPAYQKFPMHQQASFLIWRWPDIENLAERVAGPFLFEVPAHKSSRVRSII